MRIEVPSALADLLDLGQELEHGLFGVEDSTVPRTRLVVVGGSGKVAYQLIELSRLEVARRTVHASKANESGAGPAGAPVALAKARAVPLAA